MKKNDWRKGDKSSWWHLDQLDCFEFFYILNRLMLVQRATIATVLLPSCTTVQMQY